MPYHPQLTVSTITPDRLPAARGPHKSPTPRKDYARHHKYHAKKHALPYAILFHLPSQLVAPRLPLHGSDSPRRCYLCLTDPLHNIPLHILWKERLWNKVRLSPCGARISCARILFLVEICQYIRGMVSYLPLNGYYLYFLWDGFNSLDKPFCGETVSKI